MCLLLYLALGGAASASTLGASPMIWRAAILLRRGSTSAGWFRGRPKNSTLPASPSACVESTLENGNDAVFGALFWFALLGGPGACFSGWPIRSTPCGVTATERFADFGWAAARIDDLLNFLPRALTALSYALLRSHARALRCWREQAPNWKARTPAR
jgi:adenosylcobinamide-phosphate synthase